MAEETKPAAAVPAPEEVVVASDAPSTTPEKEADAPEQQRQTGEKPSAAKEEEEEEPAAAAEADQEKKISQSNSFKEESNVVSDLPEPQRKALEELKKLIQEALDKHEFTDPQAAAPAAVAEEEEEEKKKPAETETTPAGDEPVTTAEEMKKEGPAETETAKTTSEEEIPKAEEEEEEEEVSAAEKIEAKEAEEEEKPAAPECEAPVVEKAECDDKDGAKTVEAIEESVTEIKTDKKEETPTPTTTTPPLLYGIPLLNSPYSDVILLKFLRARDFKVKETLTMLKKCVRWRTSFGVDELLAEDLGQDYEKVVFRQGRDRQGRLVVYNVFGEFKDKELYQLAFSDAEKQRKLLRWLVQFVERLVREFDFSPTGVNSFVLVNDLCNSPGYGKREFYRIINKYGMLLQDNYPEFVTKQVCVNVSFWYLAYSWVYVNVFTPRSKSKFVFSSTSKTPETLFRYIAPEQVPVQYGGHSRTGEKQQQHQQQQQQLEFFFTPEDPVTQVTVKPSSNYPLEFPFTEPCTFVWELRVVGWEATYEAQFIPTEGYTVLVSKPKKMTAADDPIVCDSFKVTQPGKLVISIDNHGSSKKKKLLYRSKIIKSAAADQ